MRFMLKPCPFCANEKPNLLELAGDWYVECGAPCTAQMVLVESQAQAVLNWNRREVEDHSKKADIADRLEDRAQAAGNAVWNTLDVPMIRAAASEIRRLRGLLSNASIATS